mmetsp:Transcript_23048/g.62829  ORF Transcript_23048/g.62829 Transcript_23048/m.62829 type:complete len:450 (-) Transcript_23048:455-1804(-)
MRLLLLLGLLSVHERRLLVEHGQAGVDGHEHRQEVGGIRDVTGPVVGLPPRQLRLDGGPVLGVVDEPAHELRGGREAGARAEGAEVARLHEHAVAADGPQGVAVGPDAHHLLEAEVLVDLEARGSPDRLQNDLDVELPHLLGVRHMVGEALDLIDDNLHQAIVAGEEVDIGDAEDGLLRDLREAARPVRLHGERPPDVEADEVVHQLEAVQHDRTRNGELGLAHHPRHDLHAAHVPLAADYEDLLAAVLHDRPHVLDRESAMAVDDALLPLALLVVDLVKGASLYVPTKVILAREVELVGLDEVPRPREHRAHQHDAAVAIGLIHGHVLNGVVGPSPRLHALHGGVEHHLLVQPVLACALPEHQKKGIPRGPSLVGHAREGLRHGSVGHCVVHVVGPLLRLKLRELVCHDNPRVTAKVCMPLDHEEVCLPPRGQLHGSLNAAQACADDQ